uniref:Attacin C-terminal domain-containing protein n=1 Tax=Clastoptera arizonana TaxID=38151 RepID=A0A1B6EGM0_9HEMI
MKPLTALLLLVAIAAVAAKPMGSNQNLFRDSFGKEYNIDQMSTNAQNMNGKNNQQNYMESYEEDALVRNRRLADDKKLDLKLKMQRVNKVVSLDAIGSYSLYRDEQRKTSLKAFGSTVLWYNGNNFGLKKPGIGLQFTIYY